VRCEYSKIRVAGTSAFVMIIKLNSLAVLIVAGEWSRSVSSSRMLRERGEFTQLGEAESIRSKLVAMLTQKREEMKQLQTALDETSAFVANLEGVLRHLDSGKPGTGHAVEPAGDATHQRPHLDTSDAPPPRGGDFDFDFR